MCGENLLIGCFVLGFGYLMEICIYIGMIYIEFYCY